MMRQINKIVDFISGNEKVDYYLVGILAAAVLLPFLWTQGLWDPYESHAVEVAREAAEEGEWMPLRYDGEPVHGLPPACFWLQAAWMKVAGTGDLAVRLPLALLGLLWLLFVFRTVKSMLGRKTAFLLTVALLTSPFFFGNARHSSPHLLAAMLAFGTLLSSARLLTLRKKEPRRLDTLLPWIFLSAAFLAGGFSTLTFVAFSLAGVLLAGLTGCFTLPDFRKLRNLPGFLIFAVPGGLWVTAGLMTSGKPFADGLFDMQSLSFGAMKEFGNRELFTFHIVQAGHMLYPWFVLFPAALLWLAALSPRDRIGDREKFFMALFLGGPFLLLFLNAFLPCYLPLDMIAVCPSIAFIATWGLVFAAQNEGVKENRVLLSMGALFIALGCGSMGVDFFWALKRPVEVIGYQFDRPYPELTAMAKIFYNAAAIITGAGTAVLLLWKKKTNIIYWTICLTSIVSAFFITHHVYRVCGKYFSARQLLDAYEPAEKEGDRLVTYLMEPQSRGGEIYYFKGGAEHLESRADLENVMKQHAGRGRVIFITSHVRALYNDVFAASCGVRIKPLNEKRRWYAICSYEGPPPTEPGKTLFERIEDAPVKHPVEAKFMWENKNAITFLGYSLGNIDPETRTVKRGSWVDVELFWRSEVKLNESWKIYLDAMALQKGKVSGHVSLHHLPACGTYPVYNWTPGKVVRDFSRLHFSKELDSGYYKIRTGIFSKKGQRMTTQIVTGTGKKSYQKSTINLLTIKLE